MTPPADSFRYSSRNSNLCQISEPMVRVLTEFRRISIMQARVRGLSGENHGEMWLFDTKFLEKLNDYTGTGLIMHWRFL